MTQYTSYQATHHLTISHLHNILSHLPPLSLLQAQFSLMRTYLVSAMNDLLQFKDVGFVCVHLYLIFIFIMMGPWLAKFCYYYIPHQSVVDLELDGWCDGLGAWKVSCWAGAHWFLTWSQTRTRTRTEWNKTINKFIIMPQWVSGLDIDRELLTKTLLLQHS